MKDNKQPQDQNVPYEIPVHKHPDKIIPEKNDHNPSKNNPVNPEVDEPNSHS